MAGKRKMGCWMWALVALIVLGVLAFAAWQWSIRNHSIETLDRIDSFWTSDDASAAETVKYGTHESQRLMVFTPADAEPSRQLPVIVWLHGGGWRSGSPEGYAYIARNLAPEGFVVVNAGYRLGPDGKFPAMLEDGAATVRWVTDNIADYGGDPGRIYLMGHSAGAYNAAMLGLDRQWLGREGLPEDTIDGVVGLSGPYDFYPFDKDTSKQAFGDAPRPEATQPVNFARGDAPPMLLLTGDEDTVVRPRNSVALAKALTDAGAATDPVIVAGMNHAAVVMALSRPFNGEGTVRKAVLDFLRERERALDAAPRTGTPSVAVQGETG
ncbi:cAMP-regulated D2 protein [Alteripontixanthobacter maritimus]|uniref:cAMP-regulated D2 protein n=1 Tax=Alteripontixanthobacter maritimus TaxID=2161824 RepID=A0A369Q8K7_9SPHN|nr:alpha/beta hydrolase [Alteripontixanthobacter maritimus]RDC61221.1 cAMP-regulated D2 protein [Alteripontixanthobacter maritimus]